MDFLKKSLASLNTGPEDTSGFTGRAIILGDNRTYSVKRKLAEGPSTRPRAPHS